VEAKYTLGIDFGTDSVRVILVDTLNGQTLSTAVIHFEHWSRKLYCYPSISQYLQHPLDYIKSLKNAILYTLKYISPEIKKNISDISFDSTGSIPVAVDQVRTPLSLTNTFEDNPHTLFILWKDHTANIEAKEINHLVGKWDILPAK
jgi:L-ribulokinase